MAELFVVIVDEMRGGGARPVMTVVTVMIFCTRFGGATSGPFGAPDDKEDDEDELAPEMAIDSPEPPSSSAMKLLYSLSKAPSLAAVSVLSGQSRVG